LESAQTRHRRIAVPPAIPIRINGCAPLQGQLSLLLPTRQAAEKLGVRVGRGFIPGANAMQSSWVSAPGACFLLYPAFSSPLQSYTPGKREHVVKLRPEVWRTEGQGRRSAALSVQSSAVHYIAVYKTSALQALFRVIEVRAIGHGRVRSFRVLERFALCGNQARAGD
jgi:hypothetical protein